MIFFFQSCRPAQSPLEFTSAQIAKKRKTHTAYRRLVLKRWVFAALLTLANALCWAQKPELIVQTGHTHWVRSVAFSPDGKILASGSIDNTVKLWELKTGREIRSLVGHTGDVSSVAFSSDSKILASASYDHTVKVWDLATGNEIRTLTGHTHVVESVALSSDGKILASGS